MIKHWLITRLTAANLCGLCRQLAHLLPSQLRCLEFRSAQVGHGLEKDHPRPNIPTARAGLCNDVCAGMPFYLEAAERIVQRLRREWAGLPSVFRASCQKSKGQHLYFPLLFLKNKQICRFHTLLIATIAKWQLEISLCYN